MGVDIFRLVIFFFESKEVRKAHDGDLCPWMQQEGAPENIHRLGVAPRAAVEIAQIDQQIDVVGIMAEPFGQKPFGGGEIPAAALAKPDGIVAGLLAEMAFVRAVFHVLFFLFLSG